eukprot:TRINITY_DN87601_c0_g1_i1.p1 TRINITY_DN87601_c0_g1~~TRINITY_DN87601_c0_g1_i1.p1  ORF type:complete len:170 (-),score=19.42 TRINITY_DN87601_c0_g1_i1:44-553(-)
MVIGGRRRGGGPAPLLDNPSIPLCVVMMFINFLSFLLSSIGVVVTSVTTNNCSALPLTAYLLSAGAGAALGFLLYARLSFKLYASDSTWMLLGGLSLLVSLVQGGLLFMGIWIFLQVYVEGTCSSEAAVEMTTVCTIVFGISVAMTFFSVYFVFIPSFTLQLRSLKGFK